MARNKKGKTGGKRSTPQKQHNQNKSHGRISDDFDSDAGPASKTFTMRDTARTSEHPSSYWSSSRFQLRNQAMSFVPSSEQPMDNQENIPPTKSNDEGKKAEDITVIKPQYGRLASPSLKPSAPPTPLGADSAEERTESEEVAKDSPFASPPTKDTSSATSSDDEIVFGGRSKSQIRKQPTSNKPSIQQAPSISIAMAEETNLRANEAKQNTFDPSADFVSLKLEPDQDRTPNQKSKQRQKKRKRSRRRREAPHDNDPAVQAALDDYMENMQGNGEFDGFHVDAEGAAATMDVDDDDDNEVWATEDIVDFDNMSTSDEVMDAVSQVLSKRLRPSGTQYLVVRQGQETDEARWIIDTALPSQAVPLVQVFNAQEEHIPEASENDDDDSDSEENEDAEDDQDNEDAFSIDWGSDESIDEDEALDDSELDEKDLLERRMARMTDEHIARLYAKQEALGLNADELVIFDGAEDFDLSDPVLETRPKKTRWTSSRRKEQKSRSKDSGFKFFASEDEDFLVGDDYGVFDPMDREQYSLSNGNSKGKHKPTFPDFPTSDPETLDQLRSAWSLDRKKKKAKKAEREELRAQGLLGQKFKNTGRPDLKARYSEGLSFADLEAEFEDFLFGADQQLGLPPMGKRERKIIHEIAQGFGLKSQSQGAGKKRFPVLFKTRRTVEFDEEVFGRLRGQFERRFLQRGDVKGKGRGGGSRFKRGGAGSAGGAGRGGGFSKSTLGYREGEVVGAGASEIGTENRGRAMLEKMGWNKGMALGALGSQGILMPIQHTVKNSKAGLG